MNATQSLIDFIDFFNSNLKTDKSNNFELTIVNQCVTEKELNNCSCIALVVN